MSAPMTASLAPDLARHVLPPRAAEPAIRPRQMCDSTARICVVVLPSGTTTPSFPVTRVHTTASRALRDARRALLRRAAEPATPTPIMCDSTAQRFVPALPSGTSISSLPEIPAPTTAFPALPLVRPAPHLRVAEHATRKPRTCDSMARICVPALQSGTTTDSTSRFR